MNIGGWCIRHARLMGATLFLVVVWGLVAVDSLPRREDPLIVWRLANVVTLLPGASAERIESQITDPLEDAISQVDEVEHVISVSREGMSLIQIELIDGVVDVTPVWQQVRDNLEKARARLPGNVSGPTLDDKIMSTWSALVCLTGDNYGNRALEDRVRNLEDRVRFLPETAATELFGVQPEIIRVDLKQDVLAGLGLTVNEVAGAIRRRNVQRPAGRVRAAGREIVIEVSGEIDHPRELESLMIKDEGPGRVITLDQVSTISRGYVEPPAPMARYDGREAVVLGVRAKAQTRVDLFGDILDRHIAAWQATLPSGMEVHKLQDEPGYTHDRLRGLGFTLLLSTALVFASVFVSSNPRSAIIVALSLPLTGIIVLLVFYLTGIALQQMSFMSLVMALGLLIDNAIVVIEHIHLKIREGERPLRACVTGPSRLFMPLMVSTATTVAAFLPIYLLPGGTGEFVRSIAQGVAIALSVSLLVSLSVVPFFAAFLLRREAPKPRSWMQKLSARHERLLRTAIRHPKIAIVAVVGVCLALSCLGVTLRRSFFSPVERNQFVIDIYAPQGSAIDYTAQVTGEVERIVLADPGVSGAGSFIGRNAPHVFYNLGATEMLASHFAQMIVNVAPQETAIPVARRVQDALDRSVAGAHCCAQIFEHGAPFVAPFEVRISGPAIPVLRELGRRASEILKSYPEVRNVRADYGLDSLQWQVRLHDDMLAGLSLDPSTVTSMLQDRLDGADAGYVQEQDKRLTITGRLPGGDRGDPADLGRFDITLPGAGPRSVPLSAIADVSPAWHPASIYRRDGQRTLSVLAYPRFERTPAQVFAQFEPDLRRLAESAPPGYRIELGGENEQRDMAESQLLGKAGYSLAAIFLLLLLEFASFRLSGLILAIVPLSVGGAMCGLWLTGLPLNFMAIMGLIILMGVVVNDAVILVNGYEAELRRCDDLETMIVVETKRRMRHVVLTTVTTVAGFLPLAWTQQVLWPPLAVVVMSGLLFATGLTLVVAPAGYAIIQKRRIAR